MMYKDEDLFLNSKRTRSVGKRLEKIISELDSYIVPNIPLKKRGITSSYFTFCHHDSICSNCNFVRRFIILDQLCA